MTMARLIVPILLLLPVVVTQAQGTAVRPGQILAVPGGQLLVDAVVDKESGGTGTFNTIGEAIAAAPESAAGWVVYVAAGTYHEHVRVAREKVTLMGQGTDSTIISDNRTNRTIGVGSNKETATLDVDDSASYFTARDLTVINTAGVGAGPAVAVRCAANMSIFYRCKFVGYQDTVLAESKLQFYRDCEVQGTVDFIWGDARALFQGCRILVRKPVLGNHNVVTAQGCSRPDCDTGFSFQNCSIKAGEDLTGVETYLGRPWGNHSHVMIMQSYMGELVDGRGWVPWKGWAPLNKADKVKSAAATRTVRYLEHRNYGPGAASKEKRRVKWSGYHRVRHAHDAAEYTVDRFIGGNQWLPGRQVFFNPGL